MKTNKYLFVQWVKRKSCYIPSIQRFYACFSSHNTKITIEKSETTSETFYYDLGFMYDILHKNGNDKINKINISYEKEKRNIQEQTDKKLITIILNNKLEKYAYNIISNTNFLVCADGGANRLYDFTLKMQKDINIMIEKDKKKKDINHKPLMRESLTEVNEDRDDKYSSNLSGASQFFHISSVTSNLMPNLICGDFDSIKENVYKFYKQKSSIEIEKDTDTFTTDFDKCLNKIKSILNKNDKILVLGATGNRFDHTCANINTLYRNSFLNHIYLLGENNFLFLLKKGNNIIHVDRRVFNKMCGIIPLGNTCKVTTNGLKYNLNNEHLSFCHLISTSNEIVNDKIHVFSTAPILWFSEFKVITD